MTCGECRDLMLEVARRRAAPFVERAVVTHTSGCGDCARRLETERSVTAGLRALASADVALPSPDLEARVAAAFAALQGEPGRPQSVASPRRWLAIAASLLLAAGLTTWWAFSSISGPAPTARSQSSAAGASAAASGGAAQPFDGALTPAPAPVRERTVAPADTIVTPTPRGQRRAAASLRAGQPQAVQPAGFTLIPAAAGLPDFESGEIVRLGIAVTALPNYGIEIPTGGQSAVQADLLIGQDGQARAIRLVVETPEDLRPRR